MEYENERERFWSQQQSWPSDAFGYVFLGRAVHTLGKAAFGELWTGHEPETPDPLDLVTRETMKDGKVLYMNLQSSKPWQQRALYNVLRKARPDLELLPADYPAAKRKNGFGRMVLDFKGHKMEACRLAYERDEQRRDALSRLAVIREAICSALLRGVVTAVLRPVPGGAFSAPLSPDLWNTERLLQRFYACQMNLSDPFGSGYAGDRFSYIYLEQEGLDRLVNGLNPSKRPGEAAEDTPTERRITSTRRAFNAAMADLFPDGDISGRLKKVIRGMIIDHAKKAREMDPSKAVPSEGSVKRYLADFH